MEFAKSWPKLVRLPRNKKQTYRLNCKPQMWPLDLTLAMTLTLNFQGQIWNSLYLDQKWFNCHETKSIHVDWTLSLKCDHRIWPWLWPWPWIFKVKYGIHDIFAKNGPIATKQKADNSKLQLWPSDLTWAMTLTLTHQAQIWNLLYLCQKWSDCHETKSKHIHWTLCLKYDHRIWPWPWPWLCIFKVKFGICYISAKEGLIATKWEVCI